MADPKTRGTIPFGKNMAINPAMRLPHYDNGGAEAYQVIHERDKAKPYFALVSGVENLPRWRDVSTYKSFSDTSFMRFVSSGIIHWPNENRQKFVVIYTGKLGESVVPKKGFSDTNWRHPDIIQLFIQPLARMLREMSDRSWAHGSIRADNIFYGSDSKDGPVILGDGLSVCPGSTQSALYLPPDKALCEPMGRGDGCVEDDIYAFGVSLVMFLRKHDSVAGLNDQDLIRKKIEQGSYATLIGADRFQAAFLELLRGVLHDDSNLRWGLDDISMWLDGSRLTPPQNVTLKKANRPLSFMGNKYLYAEHLALDLHKNPNEAVALVEEGTLTQWLGKSIDNDTLKEMYDKALERVSSHGGYADNKDYLVTHLRLALNPLLPIHYKGKTFSQDGLGALMAVAAYQEKDLKYFKEVLKLNILDDALKVSGYKENELVSRLKMYDQCRFSLQQSKMGYGIERCIYIMCSNAPCLSPKFKKYFVNGYKTALLTFEAMCKAGGQVAILMDTHCIAFFSVLDGALMERSVNDLNSKDKDNKISGNLRFLAAMQRRVDQVTVPALAKVFLDSLGGVYKKFKNKALRARIKEGVAAAAKAGDLVGMDAFLDDVNSQRKDSAGFERAMREFRLLQNEYNEYNKRLANKKTYGIVNGHDTAAIVSWVIATIITLIVVFAFLAGYRVG